MITPTPAEIEAARTPAGGWTRAQLAEWGVPWPPPKGWRRELEGREPWQPPRTRCPTLTIDDPNNGGSEPGAWANHLRDTEFMNPARAGRETAGMGRSDEPRMAAGYGGAPPHMPALFNPGPATPFNQGE